MMAAYQSQLHLVHTAACRELLQHHNHASDLVVAGTTHRRQGACLLTAGLLVLFISILRDC